MRASSRDPQASGRVSPWPGSVASIDGEGRTVRPAFVGTRS
jgi:hypothetical protein